MVVNRNYRRQQAQQGFGMIEVMIALLVLALGLFGLASMGSLSVQRGQIAYSYSQAMFLAQDIAERAMTNRANKHLYALSFGDEGDSSISADKCLNAACTGSEIARWDVRTWRTQVGNSLPDADARVVLSGNVLQITLRFDDSRALGNPQEISYQVEL